VCLLIEVVAARRAADIVCHSLTQEQDAIYSRSIVREKKKKMTQTNYTHQIADTICSRMSEGESLRAICRDSGMPSEGTVRGWAVRDVDGFAERYRAARQMLLEYWADQILDIADDEEADPRSRQIRTAVRQWLMSKLAPRRYGDKLQLAGDPESPLQIMHREASVENLSDEALDALQRFTQALMESAPTKEQDESNVL
jgi:hypothetical protein